MPKFNTMQKKRENQTELALQHLLNNMLIGQTVKAQPSNILLLVVSGAVKTVSFSQTHLFKTALYFHYYFQVKQLHSEF